MPGKIGLTIVPSQRIVLAAAFLAALALQASANTAARRGFECMAARASEAQDSRRIGKPPRNVVLPTKPNLM